MALRLARNVRPSEKRPWSSVTCGALGARPRPTPPPPICRGSGIIPIMMIPGSHRGVPWGDYRPEKKHAIQVEGAHVVRRVRSLNESGPHARRPTRSHARLQPGRACRTAATGSGPCSGGRGTVTQRNPFSLCVNENSTRRSFKTYYNSNNTSKNHY